MYQETKKYNSKVIAEIPFDRNIYDSLMAEKTIVEYWKGEAAEIIVELCKKIEKTFNPRH